MKISTFHDQKDNQPSRGEASWEQLVESLRRVRHGNCRIENCSRSECPDKIGPSWTPAYWPDGFKRGNIGVEGVSALVVDIDHVKPDDLIPILECVTPWRNIIHASHSDRPDDRCLRVVLALSRTVLGHEWRRFWVAAMIALKLPGDIQTKDAARLFYRPSRPSDACHDADDGTGYTFFAGDGDILDVDEVLQFAPPEPEYDYPEGFVVPEFAGAPDADKMLAAAQVLGEAWPTQSRHSAQLALAGALARAGWPEELVADFCACVAEIQQPGNGDLNKRLAAARSSVTKVHSGEFTQGWPSLIALIGEDPVAACRALLGMGSSPKPNPEFTDAIEAAAGARVAETAREVAATPAPLTIDIDAMLRSVERKLVTRKDPDSIRDASYLKLVREGERLAETFAPEDDQKRALIMATLAVCRAMPPGATAHQITSRLLKSAGHLASQLDEIVPAVMRRAAELSPILQRRAPGAADGPSGNAPLDEFVSETSGPRVTMPVAGAQHNFAVALHRMSTTFKYDAFARRKLILRDDEEPAVVEDHHVTGIMFEIERSYNFYPPKDKFYDYTNVISRDNSFHPVIDYLDANVVWDGISRSETWLIQFGGVEDSPYARAVSRLVLIAAVRRVRQPGVKFDEMLILEGPQGTQKSSALKALCPNPEWFADQFKLDGDPKHFIEQTSGKWIVEAAELKGMSNKEHNDLKAQLSTTHDTARAAYAREPQTVARQCVIIGTTNDSQYLRDPTGDRRYWPVKITQMFDVAGLLAIRDQLWAEAAYLDLAHPEESTIRLHSSLWAAAAAEQEARHVDSAYEIILGNALGGTVGRIHVENMWKLLKLDRLPTKAEQTEITTVMYKLGFEYKRRMRPGGGERTYYYERGTGPERDHMLEVVGTELTGYHVRVAGLAASN